MGLMPQITKNKGGELVTQGILKSELGVQLGGLRKEIKNAFDEQNKRNFDVFATKQDLKESFDGLESKMTGKFDRLLIQSEKIYGKLEKKEQENTMHGYQHKTAEDKLADHDKRLGKLEKSPAAA